MEELGLIVDIVIILAVALLGGVVAHRLKMPVILGYLVGGVAIGPYGLRLVHDLESINTLANIGVILLMFALGVQFSLGELRQIGRIATLGGIGQILLTAAIGILAARLLGKASSEAIFFGFLIAISSTMIVLKTLMERGELDSLHGRIMIGLLIVQDLSVVPMMVILPSLGEASGELLSTLGLATLKAGVFLAAVLLLGIRVIPWVVARVAETQSRELFILSIVTLCLGAAFGTYLFGLSLAFGAFVAGLLLSESDFGHQALADVIPLRDTFAILFFVSIGMLVDPRFALENLSPLLLVISAIVLGKFVICTAITWLFGYTPKTALFVGSGMIQIGEFSFILARVGTEKGVLSEHLYSLILAGAIITIVMTPFALNLASVLSQRLTRMRRLEQWLASRVDPTALEREFNLSNHVVICGHGLVGSSLVEVLKRRGFSYLVIDIDPKVISNLKAQGVPCIYGDAGSPEVLSKAHLERAKVLVLTCPDPIATELAAKRALEINPRLDIVARTHRVSHIEHLREMGVTELVRPEFEASLEIIRHTLHRFGLSGLEIQQILVSMRERDLI